MKPETAAKLLVIAFQTSDLEALELACKERPWTKKPNHVARLLPHVAAILETAKRSRHEKIDKARAKVLPYLEILARYGYEPSGSELAEFGQVDTPSMLAFAREVHQAKGSRPYNRLFLHHLVAASKMQDAWIKPLLHIGFEINKQDAKGNTPAHYLAGIMGRSSNVSGLRNRLLVVDGLIRNGADLSLPNAAGVSPAQELMKLQYSPELQDMSELFSQISAQVLSATTPNAPTSTHRPRL